MRNVKKCCKVNKYIFDKLKINLNILDLILMNKVSIWLVFKIYNVLIMYDGNNLFDLFIYFGILICCEIVWVNVSLGELRWDKENWVCLLVVS